MDDKERAFLDIVSRIPPTWTCLRCARVFDNTPDGEMSVAIETKREGNRKIFVGEICAQCWSAGEGK